MPRWSRDGTAWLDELPELIRSSCERWRLTVSGTAVHGSNALVVPVTRADGDFVLRLTPPGPDAVAQVAALRFWNGRGTVHLVDTHRDAMLLERLTPGTSLHTVPTDEAMHILGSTMRRLAIPAPPGVITDVPSTAAAVARRMATMEQEWRHLGRPFPESRLREALEIGARLSQGARPELAVNGDLHSAQVLRATREDWLVVDPVLMRGEIDYDLARTLWTRLDEMPSPARIVRHFDIVVTAAETDRDRSRDWVVFRTADFWLWGLTAGLTDDPQRCARLLATF
ncbi:aminoglycoside phosphotransferase family protein [Actinoplanes derwentensis]|nr:aminoglycoside phosphotransferase family protein [Actinoplanes derwentensis]